MHQAFAAHARADARFVKQLRRSIFEDAGAHALFDVLARTRLEHPRLNAGEVQEMRKDEAGWSSPDDADLRALCLRDDAHGSSTKAAFAFARRSLNERACRA